MTVADAFSSFPVSSFLCHIGFLRYVKQSMMLLLALSAQPATAFLGSVSCLETVEASLQLFNLSNAGVNREGLELLAPREYVI